MEAIAYVLLGSALMIVLGYLRRTYFDFDAQRPEDYAEGDQFDIRTHLKRHLRNGPEFGIFRNLVVRLGPLSFQRTQSV